MKQVMKKFLLRGMMFAGFGPIVVAMIYACLEASDPDFHVYGGEVCLAIVSTYLLAFVQAGATVFNQIETWSIPKSLLWHFSSLYAAYVFCYLINRWIPFRWEILLIFTAIFVAVYFVIWLSVFLSVRAVERRLNARLQKKKQ